MRTHPITDPSDAERLERVLELGDNRTLLPRLVEFVREANAIPFVGAGLSAPYNLPQWGPLIEAMAPDAGMRAELAALVDAGEYESAAERLMEVRGPLRFQVLFRKQFEIDLDLSKKTAITCLARWPRGPILTTNFDRVIESVMEAEGCALDLIVGENPSRMSEALQYNTNALLKVHGDIQDPDGRVLTKAEYDAAYARWLTILLKNVATRGLVFLGCSLKSDRPMKVLAELAREGHVQVQHFAILSLPADDKEVLERSLRLSEDHRIDAIWYPTGQHEYVPWILNYIADQLPQERRRNRKSPRRPLYRDIPETRYFLFGRRPEELAKVIETSRIVAVEGSRGVGKTAFALQTLRLFMERETFGALAWITASARKEQLLLSHVLDAISLSIDYPYKPQTKTEEKEALLAAELKQRGIQCLLLLDNYESVTDPDIEAFLFDPKRELPNLHVLITKTGRLLREGVRPFPLDELGPEDAAALFRDRLTRDGLEQESDAEVARLYEVVGGNPLAMEWIVGQMRTGAQLPRLLAKLRKGTAEILPRVFEQSWKSLSDAQRSVLFGISVFVRPALEEPLLATTGLDEDTFHECLEGLMRLYLVKRLRMHGGTESQLAGRRYFVHPFTRDFLEGQRTQEVSAALYGRAADFYLDYVPSRGGTPEREEAKGTTELNGERENILGVLDGCFTAGKGERVVPLVQAMSRWLFIESHWDDLEKYGTMAVAEAEKLGDSHAAARILNEVGRTYSHRSDYLRAAGAFERSLELAGVEPPDPWAMAYIRHHSGEAFLRQKKFDEARAVLIESLKGFTQIGSTRSMIGVTYRLAKLALDTGDLGRARELALKGVDDAIAEDWARLEGFNRWVLGDIAVRDKDFPEARFQYERALALVPASDMRIQALIEFSLARLESHDGDRDDARKRAEVAVRHFEKLRMPREAEEARRLALGLQPG